MEHYALIEPNPLAERLARFDVFAREVYSRDPAAVPAGNKTGSSAKAASNIENMFICTEPELVEKVFGCLAPADMELIDRARSSTVTVPGALPSEASPSRIASERLPCV
jgi:hypothetical protein